jgi:hypothetical protein
VSVEDQGVGTREQVLNVPITCRQYGPGKPSSLLSIDVWLSPLLHWLCRNDFMILPPALLPEHPAVVLYLKRAFISWLLARDGHSEHSCLRGSSRRSVTPYIHRRRELYYSSWLCPCVPESENSIACVAFYCSKPQQLHRGPRPDRWPRDNLIYCIGSHCLGEAHDVFNGIEVIMPCRLATSLACAARLPRVVEPPRTIAIHCKWAAGLHCTVTVLQSPAHMTC